jgi:putative ABC transport system permease protein
MHRMLTTIALRNIFRNRRRSLLTFMVLIFGSTALIMFGGYKEISFHGVRESMIRNSLGHLQIYKQGFLDSESQRPLEYGMENIGELRRAVEADPRVEITAAQISMMGLVSNGEKSETFMATAVEPAKDEKMASQIIKQGTYLSGSESDGVIIGEGLAKSMHVKPGDSLTLMTTSVHRSLNAMDVKILGIFTTGVKEYDERAIKIPLAAAQHLLHTTRVERLLVLLKKTEDTEAVSRDMAALFAAKSWKLDMRDWTRLATFYHQVVALYNGIFGFLGMVVFIIVILSVSNTVMMSILERTREIGTMLAIGTRRSRVWHMFLVEGVMMGIIGGALGLAVGSGLATAINHANIMLPPPPGYTMGYLLRIMLTPSILATTFGIAIVTATLSSILPAVRASRLTIVKALAHV